MTPAASSPRGSATRTRLSAARQIDRPRHRDGHSDVEQHVFAVTEELLSEVTLRELSVNQICARAGLARGTFYFYFSSKYAVVAALLAKVMDDVFAVLGPYVNRADTEDPAAALVHGIAAGWEIWRSHRTLMRATSEHWNEHEQLRAIWLDIIERFTVAIAAEIDKERAAGLASGGIDSRRLAAMLLWSTERCAYVAGLGVDGDLPGEQATVQEIQALWLRAIYAETPDPAGRRAAARTTPP